VKRACGAAGMAVRDLSVAPNMLLLLADSSQRLGLTERLLGNQSGAADALARAWDASVRAVGPDDPLSIPIRLELWYQRALSGRAADSLPEMTRCLAEARARSDPEDLFHALHSLGYVLTLDGRPREGEPLLREALRVGATFLSPRGPAMGVCSRELGECLERQRRLSEAGALYEIAWRNFDAYFGPDVFVTMQARSLLDRVRLREGGTALAAGPDSR